VIRINKFVNGKTLKETIQDLKKEANEESISFPGRLYRGAYSGIFANAFSWYLFQSSKHLSQRLNSKDNSNTSRLVKRAMIQGMVISVTHPLWMIKLHLDLPQDCLQRGIYNQQGCRAWPWYRGYDIIKHEGVLNLYKGIGWSCLLSLNPILHGHIYDKIKEFVSSSNSNKGQKNKSSHLINISTAGVAQILCIGVHYPIISLRTRMKMKDPPPLKEIGQLYKGVGVHCARSATSRALIYGLFEGLSRYIA